MSKVAIAPRAPTLQWLLIDRGRAQCRRQAKRLREPGDDVFAAVLVRAGRLAVRVPGPHMVERSQRQADDRTDVEIQTGQGRAAEKKKCRAGM